MKTLVFATGLALAFAGAVQAQTTSTDYPNRPLRQIVPFPPGGGVDIVTRIVGAKWSEVLGQQIVVENRAGAGGNVGADAAARAAPDGYTLLTCQVASHGISPAVYAKLPYDHLRDFAPDLPDRQDSKRPRRASVGAGHIAQGVHRLRQGESRQVQLRLSRPGHVAADDDGALQADDRHRPGARAVQGRRAGARGCHRRPGDRDVRQPAGAAVGDQVGGKTRALAVSTLERNPQLPDVPTVAESGFPGFEVTVWYGVCTQAAVPKAIVAKLNATLVQTLNTPEMKARLAEATIDAAPMTPDEFLAFIRAETAKWERVAREAGIPKQ